MLRLLVVFHHGGIGLHPPATVWVRLVIHVLGAFLAFVALLVAFVALVVAFVTFASITSFRSILIPSVELVKRFVDLVRLKMILPDKTFIEPTASSRSRTPMWCRDTVQQESKARQ